MPSAMTRDEESTNESGTATPSYKPFQPRSLEEKAKDYLLTKEEQRASHFDSDDSIKRYTYLLGLTDLFRHFVDIRAKDDPKFRKILREVDKANEKSNKKQRSKQNRRRKTEREEDAELLIDEEDEPHSTVFTESPQFVEGTLREYQIQGLNWLISLHENSISGILADEMGLGKTLQTISFLGYLRFIRNIEGPHIVIVPKSTLDNWVREFNRWIPDINAFVLHGDKDTRAALIKDRLLSCDFDVCISSYEMVIREKAQLKKIAWQYIIVDEAHRIKNEDSMLSQIIRVFHSRNRLLITGTPLQNNLHELWALLNFLLPDVFSDSQVFDDWFEGQEDNDQDAVVQQLHKVLSPFLLRRVKADVEKSLLPKKEVNLYVGMTAMQTEWYRRLLDKDIDAVNGAAGKREGKTRLLNIVMQLRKCCNHPYLFEGAEPGPPFTTDEHLVDNAGKMRILDQLLKQKKKEGSRVLIFSQMSRVLDILEDYCMFRDYEYCRIDGSTNHEDRIAAIDDYNKEDSDKFVFLLTTRAGGLGINLTTADIVVLYDSDWNPQADLQAMDRAHRIGQTKQVQVYRFVTENAVEEKVLERAAQKLRLDQLVIQQGRANQNQSKNQSTSKDELLNMIQHGANRVMDSKDGTINEDESFESILARGEQKTQELNNKYAELGLDDLQRFSADTSAYQWNGQDFTKKNNDGLSWIGPSRRDRGGGPFSYNTDAYYKERMKVSARTPRAPKQMILNDFQFFDPRLNELYTRELNHHRKIHNYSDDPDEVENAEPLTEEEEEEKRKLELSGFIDWSKRDFTGFIHQAAKHGRDKYEAIANELDKTVEEVREYSKVFWERYKELDGYERYLAQIDAGEVRAKRLNHQQELLRQKIKAYKAPMSEMSITYPVNNAKKVYTEEEDRFLLLQIDDLGLDADHLWEKVRDRIKRSPLFRFDWFFLSRTPVELSRRCTTLLLAVTREFDGPMAMKRKSGPRPKNRENTEDASSAVGSPAPVNKPKEEDNEKDEADEEDEKEKKGKQDEKENVKETDGANKEKKGEGDGDNAGDGESDAADDMEDEKHNDHMEIDNEAENEESEDARTDSEIDSRNSTPQPPPAKRQKKTRTEVVKGMETRTRRRSSRT